MNNTHLWRALGRNTLISIVLFGALLGLLWLAEMIFPEVKLLKWHDPAWVVGIPASIIGVAYILTVRDPHNYTGFFAGLIMSVLLGIQFLLQDQYDSAFLFFFVFILFLSVALLGFITAGDLIINLYAAHGSLSLPEGWREGLALLLNGLLISSSFLANYWLIYRKTDSWIYWLIYSIAGIGLFILLGNVFSIVLFTFFLVINSMAGIAWVKSTKPENYGWLAMFNKE